MYLLSYYFKKLNLSYEHKPNPKSHVHKCLSMEPIQIY